MKIICVTGAPGSDVDKVADIFFAAGVQPALPLRQDPSFTLSRWHEKVIAAAGGDKMPPGAVKQPGRFWEQFATNLFMENMHHPVWAWGDTRSVWLLDFWQQLEPNLHFVLVYTSPQRALAEALAAEREHGADTAALMTAWAAHQKAILRFYHRNPNRAILVDAAEVCTAPDALIDACAARWNLELETFTEPFASLQTPAPLIGYLAEQLRLTQPDLQVLQQELESSLHALSLEQAVRLGVPDLFAAVEDYQQMRSAAARTDALKQEMDAMSIQLTSVMGAVSNLTDEKFEYERIVATLRQTIAERDTEVSGLKIDSAQARGENDQILQQMHQLQEELERVSIKNRQLSDVNSAAECAVDELKKKVAQSEISGAISKKELDAVKASKTATEKDKDEALAALTTAIEELEAARRSIKQLKSEQHSAKEAQQQNELLVVQLHQVQEELEDYFLKHQNAVRQHNESVATLKKDFDALKADEASTMKEKTEALAMLNAVKQTIDDLNKKVVQFEVSGATLKKELDAAKASKTAAVEDKDEARAALATALDELEAARRSIKQLKNEQHSIEEAQQQNELLVIQLHRVQEELEHHFLEHQNVVRQHNESVAILKNDFDAANSNKAAEKEKAEALAALTTTRKELETASQSIKQLQLEQDSIKGAQQENELLLVQLHQVQEELEHYFLEYKNAVKQKGELALRWQRMLERNPTYCDYHSLELMDSDPTGQRVSWRFTDLNTAGQAYPELRFDTITTGGVATIAFSDPDEIPAMPKTLDVLTTAQWMLLPTLCRILDESLHIPVGSVARLNAAQRSALRQSLGRLVQSIDALPPAVRFDRTALKREQVNPDYEHLWLELSNLSFGEKYWGNVDFRIACANVRPGKFGSHPKLEFPRDSGVLLLNSWFAESYDDFGDKLELRFAQPEAMDMAVWDKLEPSDRGVLQALINALPLILSRLDRNVQLSRNFDEWQQLAAEVKHIFTTRTSALTPAMNSAQFLPEKDTPIMTGTIQKGII